MASQNFKEPLPVQRPGPNPQPPQSHQIADFIYHFLRE